MKPAAAAAPCLVPLPGDSGWARAFFCRDSHCPCRTVLVVCAPCSSEAMIEKGEAVAELWRADRLSILAALYSRELLPGATVFRFDLDTLEVQRPSWDEGLHDQAREEAEAVIRLFDDDALDTFASGWFAAKGLALPAGPEDAEGRIDLPDFEPGVLLRWDELQPVLRNDAYVIGGRTYEASELHCVTHDCSCREFVVEVYLASPGPPREIGAVKVGRSTLHFEPVLAADREALHRVFDAYLARHGSLDGVDPSTGRDRLSERFVRRSARMKEAGKRIVSSVPQPVRRESWVPGRNDPCPCGSGLKYKKCCGDPSRRAAAAPSRHQGGTK